MIPSEKAYLIEGQIMFQIRKIEKRLSKIEAEFSDGNLSEQDYYRAWWSCKGAITQLNIVLTSYDNPLSNFLALEKIAVK